MHGKSISGLRFALLTVAGLVLLSGAAYAQMGAKDTVEKLHEALISVMRDADALGYRGRYDHLSPVIQSQFDLPFIVRIVLGQRQWNAMSEAERQRMLDAFSRLSVATYADRFDGYSGERFDFVSERDLARGNVLVRSELKKSDGDAIQLDYVLHRNGEHWQIVNVIHDGVSDLSLKRADYASVIKQEGIQALIARLEEKVSNFGGSAQ